MTRPLQRTSKRIHELGDWRAETLAHVRQLIHDADPDIQEEWKWEKHGILTFARGAPITDPKTLFNSSLDGNTRRAIDPREAGKINEAAFKQRIRAAVAANSARARATVHSTRNTTSHVPLTVTLLRDAR